MENFSTYRDAISEAEKAEGTAARKMQAYNESVAYSINQLSAAWEGFTQKLEASGAVKTFFTGLTAIIENLDHILQQLVPLIATFNADKIVSLAKFLSPLVTTPLKAIRHPVDTVRKSNGAFYENMTQKMTAENTSAIKELTNATKDNTAALRGEKSKGNNGGTNKEDTNNKISKQQIRSARLKTGVAAGLAAGAVRLANKGASAFDNLDIMGWTPFKGADDVEVSDGEAAAMGGVQAILTAGLTAWLGPLGTVIASIVGDVLSSLWKKFAHADEIDRKQRVEDAKKQLEAIKGIGNSVTGLIDLNKKDQALWDSDDWKQFNEQVETINEALEKSELGDKIIDLGNKTKTLSEYFEEAARTGNKDMLARVEAERIRFEAEKTYAAGEQDRYTLQKEINENQKKLANLDDDEISKKKELTAAIKAAKAEIEDYSEALKKGYMQASFYSSGVGTMESYDIGNATLDRVIMQIAREWAKNSPDIFAGNQLTSDARSDIISYLREQSGYSSLFKNDTKNVGDMLTARGAVDNLIASRDLKMSQKQLKEFANSKDLLKIGKSFGLIRDEINDINKLSEEDKSAVYKLIDKINLVDEDGITTIAHAMNMTVQEFERANADGAFNWLTTDVAIGGIDKLNEKMQTFNDLLSAASEGSLLTSENLNKIANQFPTLLRGVENGKYTTDLSSDNILDNIIRMMTDEDALREIYSGLFSGSVAKDSAIWNNFMTLGKGSEIASDINLSEDIKNRVKTAGSYSEIVDIFSQPAMEKYNDAFKEYVTSMYPITDLLDTQAKILEEYGKHTLETEISNLESVRDSLGDVNKQREKELELIKAKEALENASKEKKRVYRAGVGFVYTTDQEAVKSAQDKVDELERQRDKDNIQYQIDSLQQQKEILENIENNKQLESLIETAEKILGSEGSDGGIAGIIAAVKLITGDEFTNKIKEQIKAGIDESTNKTNEEAKTNAEMAYQNAINEAKAFQNGEVFTGYDNNGNATFRPMSDEEKKEFGGQTPAEIAQNPNSPYYAAAKQREEDFIKNVINTRQIFHDLGGEFSSDDPFQNENDDKIFKSEGSKRVKITNEGGLLAAFEIGGYFDWEANKEQFNTSDKKGGAEDLRYAKQNPDGTFEKMKKFDDAENMTIKEAIDSLEGPAAIMNLDGKNYIMYKGADGKTYQMSAWNFSEKKWEDPGYAAGYSSLWNKEKDSYYRNGNYVNANDIIDMFINGSSYASGTISAPGGRSLINENGLESIITPSGTITSLPAKSGIIPADLTRNLWALGEVAPNLIARLGGNNLQTNNSNSSTDNSINIQNLDATFNTQSDFDGHRFLTDLRNQIILTANNH